jgi:hypothetical protein
MLKCLRELEAHDAISVAFESLDRATASAPVAFNSHTLAIDVFPWSCDGAGYGIRWSGKKGRKGRN